MYRIWIVLTVLAFLLGGCGVTIPAPTTVPETQLTQPEATTEPTPPTTEEITEPTQPAAEAPTEPVQTVISVPDVSKDTMVTYFQEVCLGAEFINSGDPTFLQKWEAPIIYSILGEPTEKDREVLEEFARLLNTVEGFPGIRVAAEGESANMRIHFCRQEEMIRLLGDNFYGMDGGVTFWYTDNVIYDAIICIRTDIEQYTRNSVIMEEIYNSLGPIQDTALRQDSIIYADFSAPQSLTETDKAILQLLYHPDLRCGMNAAECEEAIRKLYQ